MEETRKITILVADDEKDFLEIISTKLKSSGFEVIEAENGRDAVDKIKSNLPDLVLMDVNMPEMSGVEALLNIRKDPQLAGIKIVFLTNYGEPQKEVAWLDEKFARDIGAIDYIKKSQDLDKLVSDVRALL